MVGQGSHGYKKLIKVRVHGTIGLGGEMKVAIIAFRIEGIRVPLCFYGPGSRLKRNNVQYFIKRWGTVTDNHNLSAPSLSGRSSGFGGQPGERYAGFVGAGLQ
jgi:hypothetical protein